MPARAKQREQITLPDLLRRRMEDGIRINTWEDACPSPSDCTDPSSFLKLCRQRLNEFEASQQAAAKLARQELKRVKLWSGKRTEDRRNITRAQNAVYDTLVAAAKADLNVEREICEKLAAVYSDPSCTMYAAEEMVKLLLELSKAIYEAEYRRTIQKLDRRIE